MNYYIWTPEKTTGPYTFREVLDTVSAFPLKEGHEILTEVDYRALKAMEEQIDGADSKAH